MREASPAAVILRPSVVFGPEDDFLNRFGALARVLPALPLFGGGATKLQPVFVGDVALAALAVIGDASAGGRTYELGGPEVLTLREIAALTLRIVERRRALVPLPFGLARLVAWSTEVASTLSLGRFPAALTTTRDQVELLRHDNVVSAAAITEGRTLRGSASTRRGSRRSRRPISIASARPANTPRAVSHKQRGATKRRVSLRIVIIAALRCNDEARFVTRCASSMKRRCYRLHVAAAIRFETSSARATGFAAIAQSPQRGKKTS